MSVTFLAARISTNHNQRSIRFFRSLADQIFRHFILFERSAVSAENFVHDSTVHALAGFRPVKFIRLGYRLFFHLISVKPLKQRLWNYPILFTFLKYCGTSRNIGSSGTIP